MHRADDAPHSLLERPSPPYTRATVRRAFIVWLHCGQRNRFRDVCNYYHYLEAMEDQLPPDTRASSRHLEFNLFAASPPTSPYLESNYPLLYTQPTIDNQFLNKLETIKQETRQTDLNWKNLDTVSKNGYINQHLKKQNIKDVLRPKDEQIGATRREILEASHMIGRYCKEHQIPLKNFLEEFKEYAAKCELKDTLVNVGFYIRRKIVHANLKNVSKVQTAKNLGAIDDGIKEKNGHQENSQTNFDKDSNTAKSRDLQNQIKLLYGVSKSAKYADDLIDVSDKMDSMPLHDNDDNATSKYSEPNPDHPSPIRLLKRNNNMNMKNDNPGFSSSHLAKLEVMKCRKI